MDDGMDQLEFLDLIFNTQDECESDLMENLDENQEVKSIISEDIVKENNDEEEDASEVESKNPRVSFHRFSFLSKLHLMATSGSTWIKWSDSGMCIQLDYIKLQEHLTGGNSFFNSRSVRQFVDQLIELGFERVTAVTEDQVYPFLYYYHPKFRSDLKDMSVLMKSTQLELIKDKPIPTTECDLSNDFSKLQLARMRFKNILELRNDQRLMQKHQKQLPKTQTAQTRRGRTAALPMTKLMPEVLADRYINPKDSIINVEQEGNAGFFVNVLPEMLDNFFSNYVSDGDSKMETIATNKESEAPEAMKDNTFQQNLPIGAVSSDDELSDVESHFFAEERVEYEEFEEEVPEPDNFNYDIEDVEKQLADICGVEVGVGDVEPPEEVVQPPLKYVFSSEEEESSEDENDDSNAKLTKLIKDLIEDPTDNDNDNTEVKDDKSEGKTDSPKKKTKNKLAIQEHKQDLKEHKEALEESEAATKENVEENIAKVMPPDMKKGRYELRTNRKKRVL